MANGVACREMYSWRLRCIDCRDRLETLHHVLPCGLRCRIVRVLSLSFVVLASVSALFAENCTITPQAVPQGEVVRIACEAEQGEPAEHADHAERAKQAEGAEQTKQAEQAARMDKRTIHLFRQPDGRFLGLMPVPVLERPGNYPLEVLNHEGAPVRTVTIHVLNAHYPRQYVTLQPATAALRPSPGEQDTVTAFRTTASPERFWSDTIQLPVPGCLTSRFGVQRYVNGKPTGDFHAGLDQRGAAGTPIHAIAPGVVKIVRNFNLRGGTVAIDHGQGLESIYMHMSKTAATEGARVEAGDVIGYIGATGRANGPHLHWTLYANGVPVNPAQWVKVPAACPVVTAHPR